MIELRNVHKRYHTRYGGPWVLRGVNFHIPKGISVGLIGENGSGKSTLIRLIAGMDHPDRGQVIRRCRVSWPIGLAGGLQPMMTGRQNTKFLARICGEYVRINEIIAFIQEFAELDHFFDEPVKTYSNVMRNRFAFGLSLAFDFDFYLSDDVIEVGDAAFQLKVKQIFQNRMEKANVLMVSKREGVLKHFCRAGIWLHDGQVIWFERIQEALAAHKKSISAKT